MDIKEKHLKSLPENVLCPASWDHRPQYQSPALRSAASFSAIMASLAHSHRPECSLLPSDQKLADITQETGSSSLFRQGTALVPHLTGWNTAPLSDGTSDRSRTPHTMGRPHVSSISRKILY